MKVLVEFPFKYLLAAKLCSAGNDVRYYLLGVHITQDFVEATDGHRALRINGKNDDAFMLSTENIFDLIIPRMTIDLVNKTLNAVRKRQANVSVHESGTGEYQLSCDGLVFPFTPIDGRFPDVNRIIPKHTEAKHHAGFNWTLMADFTKIAKLLGDKYPQVGLVPNELCSARVDFINHEHVQGIIMPMRLAASKEAG